MKIRETAVNLFGGIKNHIRYIYPAIVLAMASSVYMIGYNTPSALFWDENYHIASAQKYLDGVMFMEPHPPLGKMMIALGEWVLDPNEGKDKSEFLGTDYVEGHHLPQNMSFAGFRLMPVLLMALSAPLFYLILVHIIGNRHLALLFSSLVLFDNALIVHSRSAMLEGIQIFFAVLAIWYWVRTVSRGVPVRLSHYAVLGVLVSLAIAVKVNGAILLLLFVMLYGYDQWPRIRRWEWPVLLKRLATTVPVTVAALSAGLLVLMYLHIAMGTQIVNGKTYDAGPQYQRLVRNGETAGLSALFYGLQDNWEYMAGYSSGVPELDVCKAGENGSHASGWPLGKKTINYRWTKNTVDGRVQVKYLYLAANPVIWLSVLAGIVLSVSLIVGRFVYGVGLKDSRLFYWSCAFTALYLSYMLAILQIDRVMYLYHYLMPLVFGMFNLAIVFAYIFKDQIERRSRHMYINVAAFAALALLAFWHFAPLSYYYPLTENEFALRQWFEFWKLTPIR